MSDLLGWINNVDWHVSVDVFCACFCTSLCHDIYTKLRCYSKYVDTMKTAPDLRCKSVFNKTGEVVHAGVCGFIEGKVQPVKGAGIAQSVLPTVVSGAQPAHGVVSQRITTELIMTQIFGIWSSSERDLNIQWDCVPFKVVDGKLNIQIEDPMLLHSVVLKNVGESIETPQASFLARLFSYFQGVHTTGIKQTESMLVLDTEVVGIGRLVLKSSGFYLEPDDNLPYLITTLPKEDIIESYRIWLPVLKFGVFVTGLISSFFIYRLLRRYLKKHYPRLLGDSKQEKIRKLAISAARDSEAEELPSKLSCIVCCERLRNAVLVPCAHVALCLHCVQQVHHCPMCRAHIEAVQPLIYS